MKPPHRGGPAKGGSHRPGGDAPRSQGPRGPTSRAHTPRDHTPRDQAPRGHTPRDHAPRDHAPRTHPARPSGPPPDRGGSRAGSKRVPSANTLTAPAPREAPRRVAPEPPPRVYRAPGPAAPPRPSGPDAPRGAVWLYGIHAVAAALANPSRRLRRLLLTPEAEAGISEKIAGAWPLAPERTDRARLDQLLGRDMIHQGAALLADPLAPPALAQALERPGPVLVLDQITDPRNIGAILRSAAAFGVSAVITQERNAPEETGALAKAASGALEKLPLFRAVNIARTLIALKAAGLWVIGLDAGAPPLSGGALRERRVVLVLGSEGEGLRRLTRDTCDELAGLAHAGAMESLNVSAAAAIALYELAR